MEWIDEAKLRSAMAASSHVESGNIIGLGSGSTARYFINILGSLLESRELTNIEGVPTSSQAAEDAKRVNIPLTSLDDHSMLDLTVDGADQIDGKLDAIKGAGAALLREKIVATASKKYILIVDETKVTQQLGKGVQLPIEVLPFAAITLAKKIEGLGAVVELRRKDGKNVPVVTDNGNFIIDANFGPIREPVSLDSELKRIPGILETGLFVELADLAYIGTKDGVKKIERHKNRISFPKLS